VAAISSCLAALGYRTLCTDFDWGKTSLETVLGMSGSKPSDKNDVFGGRQGVIAACREHPRIPNLFYLPPEAYLLPERNRKEDVAAVFDEIRSSFAYCFVDAPSINSPAFGPAHIVADMSIIVTNCDLSTMSDVRKAISLLTSAGISEIAFLVNRYHPDNAKWFGRGIKDILEHVGLRLIGIIPEDRIIFQALNESIPLTLFYRRYSAYHFLDAARRLSGHRIPLQQRLSLPRSFFNPPELQLTTDLKPTDGLTAPSGPSPAGGQTPLTSLLFDKLRSVGDPALWAQSTLLHGDTENLVKIYDVMEGKYINSETVRNRIWLHDILDDNNIPYHIEIKGTWPSRKKFAEKQSIYVEKKRASRVRKLIKEYNNADNIFQYDSDEDSQIVGVEDGIPQKLCPECGKEIDFDFPVCPHCKAQM